MLKLNSLRLSSNPEAQLSDDKKFNVTSDGRLYLIAEFENPDNPFGGVVRRTIAQQFAADGTTPVWKVNIESIRSFVGKTLAGEVVTKSVPAYVIGERTVTSYTTVVFAHENVETVFRNAGHEISASVQPAKAVAVSQPVEDIV